VKQCRFSTQLSINYVGVNTDPAASEYLH